MHLISINLKTLAKSGIKPSHFDVNQNLMNQLDGALWSC
jgi:hypothetical protein